MKANEMGSLNLFKKLGNRLYQLVEIGAVCYYFSLYI